MLGFPCMEVIDRSLWSVILAQMWTSACDVFQTLRAQTWAKKFLQAHKIYQIRGHVSLSMIFIM